ncbi:MAG: DUF3159 domain-containing protein [Nocardioidaceae bacterium]
MTAEQLPSVPAAEAPRLAAEYATVEQLVRGQLAKALGGPRGVVEGALPTVAFTICWLLTHRLAVTLAVSVGVALVLLLARVVQRQSVQFVANSLVGILIGAVFAARSGDAIDAFKPGLIYNSVYGVLMVLSVVVGWPLVGFMVGSVMGDATGWHEDKPVVALCRRLTLVLAVPCVLRVLVQYPLYAADQLGWLATAKIFMGWPLQVAALAAMAYLLSRNRTPLAHP